MLTEAGHVCVFATPDARPAQADQRMLRGTDLGLLAPMLRAQSNAVADHDRMAQSTGYCTPLAWSDVASGVEAGIFDAVLLPGGHAPGMREYLESTLLQEAVAAFFQRDLPVAAICHGTVLVARSRATSGDSAGRAGQFPVLNRSRMLFFSSSVVCCGDLSSSPRPLTPLAGPNSS